MPRKPLCIGTSGGAGCNTAIEAIINHLKQTTDVEIPNHTPQLLKDKKWTTMKSLIAIGSFLMNDVPIVSNFLSWLSRYIPFPLLPNSKELAEEMARIENGQKKDGAAKKRPYVDMLLDVFEAGYIYAALYNTFHKKFDIKSAQAFVEQHKSFEQRNYKEVKKYFLNKLNEAHEQGSPYTEIISTQMVAFRAICDAAIEYNQKHPQQSPIKVHQYMSDIFYQRS